MATAKDFAARGKVTAVRDGLVVFAPTNTNYQLYLQTARQYEGPIGQLISCSVRVKARKVYTVPSGGGFISPLFGSPRILQGRALFVEDSLVVIRAGVAVEIELPTSVEAVDLSEGPIAAGTIVNALALPGATFELR
jgi:hypothetical protein